MNKRNYIKLLDRFYKGETSLEEEILLRKAFSKGEVTEDLLKDYYKERWDAAEDSMDFDLQKSLYKKIKNKISPKKKSWLRTACSYVAVLVAGIIGTWLVIDFMNHKNESKFYTVITEKGQKTTVILPDGTTVWLNSDSRLSYDMTYDIEERNVRLEGEGYFDVVENARKPFTVKLKDYNVTALGTSFNISAYNEDATTVTTLIEGKVRISLGDVKTELYEHQSLTYDKTSGKFIQKIDELSYSAGIWRNNELVVSPGTTLEKFAIVLERKYNLEFDFADESIKQYKFEGIIKNSQLTNVLELISISAPINYKIIDNKVIFDRKTR